jgi:hypothetical protein
MNSDPAAVDSYNHNYSAGPVIDAAYGTPWTVTTQGYAPMVVASGGGSKAALQSLLVPTMLWSIPSDTVVLQANNAIAYANKINAVQPGTVTLMGATGGHEDLSGFNGPAVVAFFNLH